jgi:heme-degrading monooxygenase HmoA
MTRAEVKRLDAHLPLRTTLDHPRGASRSRRSWSRSGARERPLRVLTGPIGLPTVQAVSSLAPTDTEESAVHARVTTLQMDPSTLDDVTARLESDDIPAFKRLDGFKGMTVLGDRESGKAIAVTFWESEEAMRESEEAVKGARQRAAETGRAGEPQVERFEVILDTMA